MSSQHSNSKSDSIDFENDSELLRDALDDGSEFSKPVSAEQNSNVNEIRVDVA